MPTQTEWTEVPFLKLCIVVQLVSVYTDQIRELESRLYWC